MRVHVHTHKHKHTHTHAHSLGVCEDSNLLGHDSVDKLLYYHDYGGNKFVTNVTIHQSIKFHIKEDLTFWH